MSAHIARARAIATSARAIVNAADALSDETDILGIAAQAHTIAVHSAAITRELAGVDWLIRDDRQRAEAARATAPAIDP